MVLFSLAYTLSVSYPFLFPPLSITFHPFPTRSFPFPLLLSLSSFPHSVQKKRALATGLAVSGTGIGTMIFAPMCEMLIAEYGWRGTFLIIGGIVTNIFACGLVFRPNDVMLEFEEDSSSSSSSSSSPDSSPVSSPIKASPPFRHDDPFTTTTTTNGVKGEDEAAMPESAAARVTSDDAVDDDRDSNGASKEALLNDAAAAVVATSEVALNQREKQHHTLPKYRSTSFPSAPVASPVEGDADGIIVSPTPQLHQRQQQQSVTLSDAALPTSVSLVNIPTYLRSPGLITEEALADLLKNGDNSEKLWLFLNRKMTMTSVGEEGEDAEGGEEEREEEGGGGGDGGRRLRAEVDDDERRRACSVGAQEERFPRVFDGESTNVVHPSATDNDVVRYLDPLTYRPYETSGKWGRGPKSQQHHQNQQQQQPYQQQQQRRRLVAGGRLRAWQNLRKDTFYRGSLYHTRTRMRSTLSCPNISHESGKTLLFARGGGGGGAGGGGGQLRTRSVICGIPPPGRRGKGGKKKMAAAAERESNRGPKECCSVFGNFLLSSLCCTCCTFCVEKLPREFRNVIYEMLDIRYREICV